jgi:CHAD domain-containing protein
MTNESERSVADAATTRSSKWMKGLSPELPVATAARAVLESRLGAVERWLPLASQKSTDDREYVHQLRVAARRAAAAIAIFAELLDAEAAATMRDTLRRMRESANEARNLDVLLERFQRAQPEGAELTPRVIDQIQCRRERAQAPLLALGDELASDVFSGQARALLDGIQVRAARGRFGRYARRCSKEAVRKLFRAAGDDLGRDENLHRLRLRAKRLRYVMEVAASAFEPPYASRLYPQVEALQAVLGTLNDHATARHLFDQWRSQCEDPQCRAYLDGLAVAETAAHDDLRRAFGVLWSRASLRKLKRQFRAYGGKP